MIIQSKVTGKKYQWIRVPRTATISYSELFFPLAKTNVSIFHKHTRYNEFSTCEMCVNDKKINLDAFTMVRNPLDRFISSIYFIATCREIYLREGGNIFRETNSYCEICGSLHPTMVDLSKKESPYNFFEFYKNEEIFYQFFYDNFNKNCELKYGIDLYSIFNTYNPAMVGSFFQTQVYWAYHPKVKIFRYEEIDKFNDWIEENLGYDTSQLVHKNASRKKELSSVINIDFTTDKFKKLVKHLFYDDFRYFNYDFPI
jgi:hypothetical protein